MKEYTYNCVDKSILLPHFKKYYVSVFFKFVPKRLTANFLTLISTGFIFYLLYAFTRSDVERTASYALLLAFCLHNYVIGDHLDGMQASVTNTSSPLGEYLDHYLDVYNGAIVFYVLTVFFRPLPYPLFYGLLMFNALSFAITMVEELERKELVFGIFGPLEGLIFLVFFFLTWTIEPVREFWSQSLYQEYERYWLVIIILGFGYVVTIFEAAWRIKYIPRQLLVFTITTVFMVYSFYQSGCANLVSWLGVTLFSGEYISKVMESHLIGKKHKYPDILVCVSTFIIGIATFLDLFPDHVVHGIAVGMLFYLGIKVLILFGLVVFQLRKHWNWMNPPK